MTARMGFVSMGHEERILYFPGGTEMSPQLSGHSPFHKTSSDLLEMDVLCDGTD